MLIISRHSCAFAALCLHHSVDATAVVYPRVLDASICLVLVLNFHGSFAAVGIGLLVSSRYWLTGF